MFERVRKFVRDSLEIQGALQATPLDQLRTEQGIIRVRWLMLALGVLATPFMPLDETARRGMFAVIGVAALYNLALFILSRTTKARFLWRGYVSSVGDLTLTVFAVAVSGGFTSPFFVAFFVLIVAVGLRFRAVGSLVGFALATLMLLTALGLGMTGEQWSSMLLKLGFVWVTALVTGVLADGLGRARRALAAELRRARTLHEATRSPMASLSLVEVLSSVAEEARSLGEADASLVLYQPSPTEKEHRVLAPQNGANPLSRLAAVPLHSLESDPGLGSAEPSDRSTSGSTDTLHAPLQAQTEIVGRIILAREHGSPFDEIAKEALAAFAGRASLALQNASLYEDLQERLQEIRLAQAQLVQSEKLAAVGELSAQVAHEINNPLGGVLLQVGLLREDELPVSVHQGLQVMEQEVLRARDIVRNLLDFARQTEPGIAEVQLNPLINSTVALCRHRAAMQDVSLDERYDETLPIIHADGNQLKQVFINLLTNALDVMPRGGALAISTRLQGEEVVVEFRDTGPGIPPEVRERIFEPFFTTKADVKGTGLGLSVSHGIVASHGGHIEVQTEQEQGTTFSVWLSTSPDGQGADDDT
ncbi:MAG: hypothetical protein CL878_09810 [Dehalococcoidia bacterium]|nr:hypothetical protein [Dehalococcoidia bacterium]